MDFEPENAPSEALLADRLARLAAWRCAATRRRSSLSSGGSDDEGNQRVRPRCTAAQALKELLQGRAAVLDGAALRAGTRDVTEDGSSCEAVDVPVPLPVPLVPIPSHPCGALVPGSDGQPSECSDDCGSVAPTARLLIQLSSGVGRAEAAGERLQRAAELRAADAAVREAEVREQQSVCLLSNAGCVLDCTHMCNIAKSLFEPAPFSLACRAKPVAEHAAAVLHGLSH